MSPRSSAETSKAGLRADFLCEEQFPAWRSLINEAPAGSPYSDPYYLDALCTAAGGSFRILGAWKGDELVGGVGLYERRYRGCTVVRGRFLLYYNGLVLKDYDSRYPSRVLSRQLAALDALATALEEAGYDHVLMRNRHPTNDLRLFQEAGWTVTPSYSYLVWFREPDVAFKRIEQNQRRLIKRCENEGVSLVEDDAFPEFYALHRQTAERKGAPIYLPEAAFERFFRTLRDEGLCRLFHARRDGGPAMASQLVLTGDHEVTHTVAAAADPEHLRLGTTPFLRWSVCRALAEEGYGGTDLTDAGLNEVNRFKSRLGGELVLNPVLSSPGSRRYRAVTVGTGAYRWIRAAARGLVRRSGGAAHV